MNVVKGELEKFMDGDNYSISPEDLKSIIQRNIPMEKPKRAPSAFLLWKADNKELIKSQIPEGSNGRGVMASKAGEIWSQLNDVDKQNYIDKSSALKETYLEEMKKYKEVVVIEKPKGKRGRPSLSEEEKALRKAEREEKKKASVSSSNDNDLDEVEKSEKVEIASVQNVENVEEVDVNVEDFTYEGKDYLLDSNSGDLYDIETEEIVGKKTGTKIILF